MENYQLTEEEVRVIRSGLASRLTILEIKLVEYQRTVKQDVLDKWEEDMKICQSLLLKLPISGL